MKLAVFTNDAQEFAYGFIKDRKLPTEVTVSMPINEYMELMNDVFELSIMVSTPDVPQDKFSIKQFRLANGLLVNITEVEPGDGVSWQVGPPENDQKNFKSVPVNQVRPDFTAIPGYQDVMPAISMQTLPNRA